MESKIVIFINGKINVLRHGINPKQQNMETSARERVASSPSMRNSYTLHRSIAVEQEHC